MGKDKGKGSEGKADTTMWMVTFGDLLMLLLTFFVMLLTMSSMDTKALKSAFSLFDGGIGALEFSSLGKIKDLEKRGDLIASKGIDLSMLTALNERLDGLLASLEPEEILGRGTLERVFGKGDDRQGEAVLAGLGNMIDISEDDRGVVLTIRAELVFDSGKSEIRSEMLPLLDTVAKLLKRISNEVLIMGHTDNIPSRSGQYRSNWDLSLYRALNVYRYFLKKKGLSSKRLFAGGYGDLRPRFSNSTKEGRKKNRRVEIILRKT